MKTYIPRQVWMYCTLYKNVERFRLENIYKAAVRGGEFLRRFVKNQETGKCYFSLTRDGKPIKVQRTIYSEVQSMSSLCQFIQYFIGFLCDGYVRASLTDWGRYLQVVTQFNPDISSPLQPGGGGHDGEDPGLDWGQGGGAGQTRAPGGGPGESGDRSGE